MRTFLRFKVNELNRTAGLVFNLSKINSGKKNVFFLLLCLSLFQLATCQIQVVSICPGTNVSFYAGVDSSNYSYQWQVDKNDGKGVVNIKNGGLYAGALTSMLSLSNAQSTIYGYKYRCLFATPNSTVISKTYVLKFGVIWIGTENASWANTVNWGCGILPDSNTDVIINRGASIYPVLNFNTSCRSLNLDSTATFNVQSGFKLTITGTNRNVDLNNNVHIIDSSILTLASDSSMLRLGIYSFTSNNGFPNFLPNDFIVGSTNNGYIRKIISVNSQPNNRILNTSQGNMENVFEKENFNFYIDTENLTSSRNAKNLTNNLILSQNGYSFQFNDLTLYQNGPLTIKLNNGSINLNPNWYFNFDFKNSKLNTFEMSCNNADLSGNFEVNVSASQAASLIDRTDTLKRFTKSYTKWVLIYGIPVPVVIEMELDFLCKYSASISAGINRDLIFNSTNKMDLGVKYSNSKWQSIYNFKNSKNVSLAQSTGNVNTTINMAIIPKFNIKLYGIAGPYASIGLQELIAGNIASPSLDWDFSAGMWLQTILGANISILGNSLFDYNTLFNTDTLFYKTPYQILKTSGDNQTGQASQILGQPLKVQILDNNNKPQSNVPVYFDVTARGGTAQPQSITTDESGYAETQWQLGSQFGIQYLEVSAKKADGTLIQNAPLEFASTINSTPSLTTTSISSITQTTAISGGNITSDGGSAIIARGVCWSTSPNPTVFDNKTFDGNGIGEYASNMNGLVSNTTYYIKAYAINSTDTAYGNILTFITGCLRPQNVTVSSITDNSAMITWDKNKQASSYNLYLDVDTIKVDTSENVVNLYNDPVSVSGISDTTYKVTGLYGCSKNYRIFMQSVCGNNLRSDTGKIYPIFATTGCDVTCPISCSWPLYDTCDFTGSLSGSTNIAPLINLGYISNFNWLGYQWVNADSVNDCRGYSRMWLPNGGTFDVTRGYGIRIDLQYGNICNGDGHEFKSQLYRCR